MEIVKIEPRWNLQWANTPDVVVTVDELPKFEWIYRAVPQDARDHVMLISTNNDPWVKFVYIEDPQGAPNLYGALGGEYNLTDGDVLKSRSGWSSRAGIINRDYRDYIYDEIVDVTLYEEGDKLGFAGFNLYAYYLANHPLWPNDCYLVRDLRFHGNEPYWTISTDPDEVKKPEE